MNEPNNAHEFRPPNLRVPENVRQLSCGMQPLQTNRPLVPVKLNRNLFRYVHSTPMSERSKGGASRAKGHENELEQIKLQELRSRLPKNFRSSFVNIDHMDYESLQRIVDLASTLSLDEDNDEDETKYSSVRDASLKHDALTSPVTNWLPDPYVAPCDSLDDPFLVIDENLNRSICDLDEKHARQSIEELWNKEHHVVAVALQQEAMARKAQRRVRKRIEKLKRLEKEYQCRAFWDTLEQQDAHREAQEARRAAEKQLSAEKIRITRELRRTLTTPRDQINAQYSFSGAI